MKLFIISRDETQRVMTTRQSKSKYEIEMLMENDVYAEIASRQVIAKCLLERKKQSVSAVKDLVKRYAQSLGSRPRQRAAPGSYGKSILFLVVIITNR